VLPGSTRGLADRVNVYEIHRKGVHIVGAHNRIRPRDRSYPHMWTARDDSELILRLLADQVFSVEDLITHEMSWKDAPEAFRRLERRDDSMLGCIIRWSGS